MVCLEIGKPYTGKGEKPDDKWTLPLCKPVMGLRNGCHITQHKGSEAEFWMRTGLDPFKIAANLWIESGAAARHANDPPGPPKKPKRRRTTIAARGFPKIKRPFPKRRVK